MNLAVSDITFAVLVAPNHILKKTFTHPEGTGGTELCRILTKGNVAWLGAASSSLTLVAIAVERYYTVMGPLGSKGKLSKKKVKVSKQKKKRLTKMTSGDELKAYLRPLRLETNSL